MEFKRDRKLHRFIVTGIKNCEPFQLDISAWDSGSQHTETIEHEIMPYMDRALNEYGVMRDVLHNILLCYANPLIGGTVLDTALLRGWTFFDTPDDVVKTIETEGGVLSLTCREGFAESHGISEGDQDYVLIRDKLYFVVEWQKDWVVLNPCEDRMHSRTAELLREHYREMGLAG